MSQPSPVAYLTIRKGPKAGSAYPLPAGTFTIGRYADNAIVIDDPMVSRHHARLTWQGNTFLLEDLKSANGTWVNNARITSPVLLRAGDVVGLSQEILLVFSSQPHADETLYQAPTARPAPVPAVVPPSPPLVPPPARAGQGWLAFGIGGVLALLGVVALIVVGVAVYLFTRPPSSQAVLPASVTVPTATPYPTYTPIPTEAPTHTPYPTYTPIPTPYPTYTPYPTAVPTATPYPTYTPFPTAVPTATPYPTYTPYPTTTPRPAPPANPPTATPQPPPPPSESPPYVITLGRNVGYEPWGNPADPKGCKGPYDDRIPVRRFTVEVIFTNDSDNYITCGSPIFVSASGASLPRCYFPYDPNNPSLPVAKPGETKDVTFVTHLQRSDYVQALVFELPGWTITLCLNGAGQQIPCK